VDNSGLPILLMTLAGNTTISFNVVLKVEVIITLPISSSPSFYTIQLKESDREKFFEIIRSHPSIGTNRMILDV
jgi:hypothetical protein